MRYVKQILFPDEKVLYDGHVHPRVLFHGIVLLAASALVSASAANTGGGNSPALNFFQHLGDSFTSLRWLYVAFWNWQAASPSVAFEFKLISLGLALWGLYHLIRATLLMRSTELVVTDLRIIAKMGIMNIVTLEMDRRRVAEVLIDQSFLGRIFNYGHIYIRGFTGVIGGMPVMVNPHLIERFVNLRY